MDKILFEQACDNVMDCIKEANGIGTLSEKTVHAVLKNYLDPDTSCHEIKVGSFYADIDTENGIIEIQTRNFDKLRKKLDYFLTIKQVTLVYPVPYIKWIRWINEETGEVSPPRKSPRTGKPYIIFPELYKIKNYLLHPNLKLHIILMNLEEYRFLNGWSKDKKKGSTRCDRFPTELVDEITIQNLTDYNKLLPDKLPDSFTTSDYKKAAGLSQRNAVIALNVLHYVGAVKRVGKHGRAYLYTR